MMTLLTFLQNVLWGSSTLLNLTATMNLVAVAADPGAAVTEHRTLLPRSLLSPYSHAMPWCVPFHWPCSSSISERDDVGVEADGECHSAFHTPQGLPEPRTTAGHSNVLGKHCRMLPLVVCSSLGFCHRPLLSSHSPWAVQHPHCRTQRPAERHVLRVHILRQGDTCTSSRERKMSDLASLLLTATTPCWRGEGKVWESVPWDICIPLPCSPVSGKKSTVTLPWLPTMVHANHTNSSFIYTMIILVKVRVQLYLKVDKK